MEQAGRSKIHEAKRWLNLLRCRIMISEVIHELFMHQASWCPRIPLKKFMKTFSWCLNMGKLKTEQKFIFLQCLDSLPLFNCFVGKLVLSLARPNFLTGAIMWTWFQSLLPAPPPPPPPSPTRGIHFLIQVHNYTKVKGRDLEKITS